MLHEESVVVELCSFLARSSFLKDFLGKFTVVGVIDNQPIGVAPIILCFNLFFLLPFGNCVPNRCLGWLFTPQHQDAVSDLLSHRQAAGHPGLSLVFISDVDLLVGKSREGSCSEQQECRTNDQKKFAPKITSLKIVLFRTCSIS